MQSFLYNFLFFANNIAYTYLPLNTIRTHRDKFSNTNHHDVRYLRPQSLTCEQFHCKSNQSILSSYAVIDTLSTYAKSGYERLGGHI